MESLTTDQLEKIAIAEFQTSGSRRLYGYTWESLPPQSRTTRIDRVRRILRFAASVVPEKRNVGNPYVWKCPLHGTWRHANRCCASAKKLDRFDKPFDEYYEEHLSKLPTTATKIAQLMHDYAQRSCGMHDVRDCEDTTQQYGNWLVKIAEIEMLINKSKPKGTKEYCAACGGISRHPKRKRR